MEKQKKNINFWLTDENFLNNSGLEGDELVKFKSYCHQIYLYLKNIPFPMVVFWNKKYKFFHFKIGINYCHIPLNTNISLYDFQRLIYYWSRKFYPSYNSYKVVERELEPDEIAELIRDDSDIENLFNETVKEKIRESLVIEKVIVKEDQLIVTLNNIKQIRITKIPVSIFLAKLRKIENQEERKSFIDGNTRILNEIYVEKPIEIKYEGEELINFFKIWCISNHKLELIKTKNLVYKWDKFIIYFSNEQQVQKCINIIKYFKDEYQSEENIDSYLYKTFGIKQGEKENYEQSKRSDVKNTTLQV